MHTRLARRIFELKRRREQLSGAFVKINCATLRGDHAMSTLFGHVKGAFTGAASNRPGLLMTADRQLFSVSRLSKSSPNDADRLRKYLARFGLNWSDIASPSSV